MRCPKCNTTDTRVIDSRTAKNGLLIRRRRQCRNCDYRFTTLEEIVREGLAVLKRDGRREGFDRNKMLTSLRHSCEKRPIDAEQLDMLISDVAVSLESDFDYEIPSRAIAERLMEKLKKIDRVAFVRFACQYMEMSEIFAALAEGQNSGKPSDEK